MKSIINNNEKSESMTTTEYEAVAIVLLQHAIQQKNKERQRKIAAVVKNTRTIH